MPFTMMDPVNMIVRVQILLVVFKRDVRLVLSVSQRDVNPPYASVKPNMMPGCAQQTAKAEPAFLKMTVQALKVDLQYSMNVASAVVEQQMLIVPGITGPGISAVHLTALEIALGMNFL